MPENVKLRRLRQRRYKLNRNADIKEFNLFADVKLMQHVLRQVAPEQLPPKAPGEDHSFVELQRAYAEHINKQWLGSWDDTFKELEKHKLRATSPAKAKPAKATRSPPPLKSLLPCWAWIHRTDPARFLLFPPVVMRQGET